MAETNLHVVTGAFGYSGKYITKRLLAEGRPVRTLTNSPRRVNPFGGCVEVHPFNFDNPTALTESLKGAAVLYNTYWVRFNHKTFQHSEAVDNTKRLFEAAAKAGVGRIVHVSITNPSLDSPLEYFQGKAVLEKSLKESGVLHTILRPAVLFGPEDILINNIAWALRHLPVFGVFGDGKYRLQPIHVDDLAKLAVEEGAQTGDRTVDAIGPETFTYIGLAHAVAEAIGVRRPILPVPPWLGYAFGTAIGKCVGDVMITREEIKGLMADLLCTDSPPAGETRLTDWVRENADTVGRHYASELARRRDRRRMYAAVRDPKPTLYHRPDGPVCYEVDALAPQENLEAFVDSLLRSGLVWYWESDFWRAGVETPSNASIHIFCRLDDSTRAQLIAEVNEMPIPYEQLAITLCGVSATSGAQVNTDNVAELVRRFIAEEPGPLQAFILRELDGPTHRAYIYVPSSPGLELAEILDRVGADPESADSRPYSALGVIQLEMMFSPEAQQRMAELRKSQNR
ncbi:MAG TPA: NAD(P)H-binding protein [Armatimonadota bacterium]|jgi:NADH dehydrogenase